MRIFLFAAFLVSQALIPGIRAQEASNLPADPFANIDIPEAAADYAEPVNRKRGSFDLDHTMGTYVPGDHFAHWHWKATPERWGNYYVGLRYSSNRTKLGVQVKIGDLPALKSYAPRTGKEVATIILGTVYIPKSQEYPVMLLTGDKSNVPEFAVKGIEFIPAPESEPMGQSIDGTIHLEAKTATTYSERMRYEPDTKKNCLGFWNNEEDWAEWKFDVSSPGEFEVSVIHGCNSENAGSKMKLLVNDQELTFKVEDTGGFQNWKEVSIGKVKIDLSGEQKAALIPVKKAGKGMIDLQQVVFTPVSGS